MFGWLRRAKPAHVDHWLIRESARLDRTRADAELLLTAYFTHGWLSRRRVKTMGARRWGAAYRLLRSAGLIDPINGHVKTRHQTRAVAHLHTETAAMHQRLAGGRFTLPF